MTYQVRHADPAARDISGELTRLWAENLAMSGDLLARLRWAYQNNPEGSGELFVLEWLEAPDDPQTVGCIGLTRRAMVHRGKAVEAVMFGQFAVDSAHRSLGPAMQLVRSANSFVAGNIQLGYGFPLDTSVGVLRRAGHREVGKLIRYARVLEHRPYLEKSRSAPLRAAAVLGPAIDAVFLAPAAWGRFRARGVEFSWLDRADGRFDVLWEDACGRTPFLGDRRQRALNWRFACIPGSSCRFATVSDRAGRLLAYAAVDRSDRSGCAEIKDFLARGDADLKVLLDHLAVELARAGHSSMSVRFLGPRSVVGTLAAAGFKERQERRTFMVLPGRARQGSDVLGSDVLNSDVLNSESWFLTDGDEDW